MIYRKRTNDNYKKIITYLKLKFIIQVIIYSYLVLLLDDHKTYKLIFFN